jgi:mannose-6-phosphate isomerase-like protein (cupin superfamily)
VYAAKTENPSVPTAAMRVSLSNFETELQSGEFYIGQSGAYSHGSGSQSVLIVFSGTAQVLDRDSIVSLNAGQIYYNVEQPIGKGSQISNTTTTEIVLIRKPTPAHDSETKQMYRERVVGFETELKQLRGTLALQTEKNAQSEELEHRTQRVEEYLKQHRQRFETMNASEAEKQLPYEQIQRGIQGRTNPATWKM